jgi:myo-inositol 2-dehydrogenase/D-chiro-inositol 1-dehydrogenase
MPEPLKIAVAGLGRMGRVHAQNVLAIAETGACQLAALVDGDAERLHKFAEEFNCRVPLFQTVGELAEADVCRATLVITPTARHREHATTLVRAGHRVFIEKPLTGTLQGDREFVAELDANHPDAVMIAFQRRFDAPLQYARELMRSGIIGRVFKIYSALEDSGPAPNGYQSDGILADMSIHNVDEVLWLTGQMPVTAIAIGSRIYSHRLTTCTEDFDDALLYMWFEDRVVAQVQVTRNHVSGYRVESTIFGEEGQIQIGRFAQNPDEVVVEAYGRRFSTEPLARRRFPVAGESADQPEFVARFGDAYRAEVAAFIECCSLNRPFPITHRDSFRAQQVISAGMQRMLTSSDGVRVANVAGAAGDD